MLFEIKKFTTDFRPYMEFSIHFTLIILRGFWPSNFAFHPEIRLYSTEFRICAKSFSKIIDNLWMKCQFENIKNSQLQHG